MHACTYTHIKGTGKTDYSGTGEEVTNRASLGTFCHRVVTKQAGTASDLTRFVTLVIKCAGVTKRADTA